MKFEFDLVAEHGPVMVHRALPKAGDSHSRTIPLSKGHNSITFAVSGIIALLDKDFTLIKDYDSLVPMVLNVDRAFTVGARTDLNYICMDSMTHKLVGTPQKLNKGTELFLMTNEYMYVVEGRVGLYGKDSIIKKESSGVMSMNVMEDSVIVIFKLIENNA